ncbi:oxidoreductase [Flavipsychrobacter stenotrophus]|uniref:Oxidoreductase n=1 Tax=Flavipsychrobacter stenotrophus TaxID=2077091 RepID=A0A2S7STA9_9BACT|nr:Gfo/Idh/MocA family oxidoreductase [Flavipsychrobacter stenotrophus]PQJ10172.1 oxidoreductase [Flavipsychrobacter stenotrophus]
MLKVGVLGAGHLGKIHIQQWQEIEGVELVGFYDPSDVQAASTISQYQVPRYTDLDALIAAVDAIDIVAPTTSHYELAKRCLLSGKHLFIEKPLAHNLEEGKELVKLVKEANVKCQIGHVERYNPAFLALGDINVQPMFIEAHRLAQFNPRGTDVSVIFDLMIHDIDIVLCLVKSPVKRISASGVSVLSENADIANARIEFDNGCVANLTSSRISLKKMRKVRLFQRDAYIGIDFLEKKTEIIRLKDTDVPEGMMDFPIEVGNGEKKIISVQMPEVSNLNAIRTELEEFASAIVNNKPVRVSVLDGYHAMDVAHQILKKMSLHNEMHNV